MQNSQFPSYLRLVMSLKKARGKIGGLIYIYGIPAEVRANTKELVHKIIQTDNGEAGIIGAFISPEGPIKGEDRFFKGNIKNEPFLAPFLEISATGIENRT